MTFERAKEIGIELWTRIAKSSKANLFIKDKILKKMLKEEYITFEEYALMDNNAQCPLCAYYSERNTDCEGCPLDYCLCNDSPYSKWIYSYSNNINHISKHKNGKPISSRVFARQVLDKIKGWNI